MALAAPALQPLGFAVQQPPDDKREQPARREAQHGFTREQVDRLSVAR